MLRSSNPSNLLTGSPESRALARALAQQRKPKLSRDDQDALRLYRGHIYLRADTDPDSWFLANTPAYRRGQELRQIQGEPVDNARWHEHVNRSTEASLYFELAFGRQPRAGEILRFTDIEADCAISLLLIADFIEAWRRQIPDTPCPLKIDNGVLYRNHKQQKITTWTQEGGWKTEEGGGWKEALDETPEWDWRYVEECAVGDYKHLTTPLEKIPTIQAVVFMGMAGNKHTCRPATEDEIGDTAHASSSAEY